MTLITSVSQKDTVAGMGRSAREESGLELSHCYASNWVSPRIRVLKPGPPVRWPDCAGTLRLDFSASGTVRNKRLVFKPPSLLYSVMATKQIKTLAKQPHTPLGSLCSNLLLSAFHPKNLGSEVSLCLLGVVGCKKAENPAQSGLNQNRKFSGFQSCKAPMQMGFRYSLTQTLPSWW